MKKILLMADTAGGNGPKKSTVKTMKVRNVSGQPVYVDGIYLPPHEVIKGKISHAAPVVELPEEHRARLGLLVENAE